MYCIFIFAQAIFAATIAYKALQDEENASGSNGGGSSRGFTDAAKAYSLTLAVSCDVCGVGSSR